VRRLHQRLDGAAELIEVDGLEQHRVEARAARVHVRPGESGEGDRDQRFSARMTSQLAHQLDAVHLRHGEVGDDRVDLRRRVEMGEGLEAVPRRQHAGPAGPEVGREHVERVVGVLGDDQREAGQIRQVDRAH